MLILITESISGDSSPNIQITLISTIALQEIVENTRGWGLSVHFLPSEDIPAATDDIIQPTAQTDFESIILFRHAELHCLYTGAGLLNLQPAVYILAMRTEATTNCTFMDYNLMMA